uniref:Uncharacterized protein n=1 Tax=Arundo donax TaxID=35708 RepID=A0A0A9BGQ7_ARUDO
MAATRTGGSARLPTSRSSNRTRLTMVVAPAGTATWTSSGTGGTRRG